MAKAVLCPVCNGSGQYEYSSYSNGTSAIKTISQPCHGCNGKGWVEVAEEPQPYYIDPIYPYTWWSNYNGGVFYTFTVSGDTDEVSKEE